MGVQPTPERRSVLRAALVCAAALALVVTAATPAIDRRADIAEVQRRVHRVEGQQRP